MHIREITESISKILEEQSENKEYEYDWKFQDMSDKILDYMISKLQEIKEYNEIYKLKDLVTKLSYITEDLVDLYKDFQDEQIERNKYIELQDEESVKEAEGWMDTYLSRLQGLVNKIGIE